MAEHHLAILSDLEHPAPHRERVALAALTFGLAAAPLAWAVQLLVNYAASSYVCGELARRNEAAVWTALLIVDSVALLIAVAGTAIAYGSWRTARYETAGDTRHMIESGHGRTRFLAMWGMMISLGFLLAIVFGLIGLFVVPLCGS